MTDLFTAADQRKKQKEHDALLQHCALVLTKALKRIDKGRIGDNVVRKEIRDAIQMLRAS